VETSLTEQSYDAFVRVLSSRRSATGSENTIIAQSKFVSQQMQTARARLWLPIGSLLFLERGEFSSFGFMIKINI